jgi:hypothetical protein
MNHLSKELQKQIPEFKTGELYRFRLLNLKYDKKLKRTLVPNSKNVLSQDVIFDPYLDGGSNVTIECVDRKVTTGRDSQKEYNTIFRRIVFGKQEGGTKVLNGKNRKDMAMFKYLYMSNYNAANKDKEWFIAPIGGCTYEFVLPEKSSADKVETAKSIHIAEGVVLGLSDKDLRVACEALGNSKVDKFKYSPNMHEAQMRESLLAFAKTHPSRVTTLDKDLNLEVRRAIREAKKAGVISYDLTRKEVVYTDSGNRICIIEDGKDAETTLVGYFITQKGRQTLKTILANLQEKPKKVAKGEKV